MKIFVHLFLFLLPSVVLSQNFEQVYPAWEHNALHALLHWNGDTVFAAGNNTTLLRSTDAGQSWDEMLPDNLGYDIKQLETNGNEVFIRVDVPYDWKVENDGTHFDLLAYNPRTDLLRTIEVPRVENAFLYSECCLSIADGKLFFFEKQYPHSPDTMKAVLYASTDAGYTWTPNIATIAEANPSGKFQILFVDETNGILVCDSLPNSKEIIFLTSDGGTSWAKVAGTTQNGTGIIVPNKLASKETLCFGTGAILYVSTDGGQSWVERSNIPWNASQFPIIRGILKNGGQHVNVLGIEGDMYFSSDLGESWAIVKPPSLLYASNTRGASDIVSYESHYTISADDGSIITSSDAGLTWDDNRVSIFQKIFASHFFDDSWGVMYGHNRQANFSMFKSSDGGRTWQEHSINEQLEHASFHFASWDEIFALAKPYNVSEVTLYRSTNQGLNWTKVSSWVSSNNWSRQNKLAGIGDTCIVLGNDTLRVSFDGGASWTISPVPETLWNPKLIATPTDNNDLLIRVYDAGLFKSSFYVTSDLGHTWSSNEPRPSPARIYDMTVLGKDTIVMRVMNGLVPEEHLLSIDGGITWTALYSGSTTGFNSFIYFPTVSIGFYNSTCIFRSFDWWKTKEEIFCISDQPDKTTGVQFIDANHGWIVTDFAVYRTTDGGTNWVESPLPVAQTTIIKSLYPNPVAGGQDMVIELGDALSERPVRMTMHDVLGKQVAVVFDGNLVPGQQSLTWHVSDNIRPGTYLLKVQSGDIIESRQFTILR